MGIEGHINGPGILIFVKHSLPSLAPIASAENSTLGICPKRVPQSRYKNNVRIPGIHNYPADGATVTQSNVLPALSAIERLVHPVPVRNIAANASLAGAHVHSVRFGLGKRHASD